MAKKIAIIIEDDWELNGNGVGNVAELQYLPCDFLLRMAKTYGFKISFMVEVLQQLAYRRYEHDFEDLRIQADLWDSCVLRMRDEGHDVQLHIHPQWYGARIDTQGYFLLSQQWNIATYDAASRMEMLRQSIHYLTSLLSASGTPHEIHSFKTGAWAIQPSEGILQDLEAVGIKIVLGVGKGLYFKGEDFFVDYRGLECADLPYFPDYTDICRVSPVQTSVIVCPLAHYRVRCRDVLLRLLHTAREHLGPDQPTARLRGIPSFVRSTSPMSGHMRLRLVRPLDVAANPFGELVHAFKTIIRRAESADRALIPVVIQTHSKKYSGNWTTLERFFKYLTDEYKRQIVFLTLSELLPHLNEIALLRREWHASAKT